MLALNQKVKAGGRQKGGSGSTSIGEGLWGVHAGARRCGRPQSRLPQAGTPAPSLDQDLRDQEWQRSRIGALRSEALTTTSRCFAESSAAEEPGGGFAQSVRREGGRSSANGLKILAIARGRDRIAASRFGNLIGHEAMPSPPMAWNNRRVGRPVRQHGARMELGADPQSKRGWPAAHALPLQGHRRKSAGLKGQNRRQGSTGFSCQRA